MNAFDTALNKYLDLQAIIPEAVEDDRAVARTTIRDSITRMFYAMPGGNCQLLNCTGGIVADGNVLATGTEVFPDGSELYPVFHAIRYKCPQQDLGNLVEDLVYAQYQKCGGTEFPDPAELCAAIRMTLNNFRGASYG